MICIFANIAWLIPSVCIWKTLISWGIWVRPVLIIVCTHLSMKRIAPEAYPFLLEHISIKARKRVLKASICSKLKPYLLNACMSSDNIRARWVSKFENVFPCGCWSVEFELIPWRLKWKTLIPSSLLSLDHLCVIETQATAPPTDHNTVQNMSLPDLSINTLKQTEKLERDLFSRRKYTDKTSNKRREETQRHVWNLLFLIS